MNTSSLATSDIFSDLENLATLPALGLVVPPSNPTVEPEIARLIPTGARQFVSRLSVMPDTTLEQRNRAYIAAYAPAIQAFGSLKLSAITIGLTGPSYRFGPQGDARLAADLSAKAATYVETASGAIRAALAALKAKRICLFSPYPQWLTDEAASYWTAAGFEIAQVIKVSEVFRAYELTVDEVREALRGVDASRCDAIVMSGTGMITLPAMIGRADIAIPMLSSNLCCAWWMMKAANIAPGAIFSAASPGLARDLAQG